ncbi:MAG: tripartite tricarboxylate transporter substrate binding protein [Alicyclobacillus herbarius]|uniref:Bug family tripartite tricarboxylate transporter substrate binding protein n=1 Tax=Alicyclobacillus herbarius TaxID=122960 RepID=UPI002355FB23|nr:tripartite tricarboxylate transporter substrate binding protein [Alicyclobacillus herbarius]MCL6633388.1 tripartite tricarboxylate transporter substrate binding protein [Alicyclobacillus herbarius]
MRFNRGKRSKCRRMQNMIAVLGLGGILTTAGGCGATSAGAGNTSSVTKQGDSSYPEHTITFIVPYAPGGDFDTTARLLAPYLTKYLPHHPSVIVKNVPGGNSVIGDMQVINAQPDGYTIGYFTLPGIALGPLIGQGNYDLTKVSWVGQVFAMPYVAAASKHSGLNSLRDVQKASHLKVGTTGITTTAGLISFISLKSLGVKNSTTVPSGGSSQSVLAASQGTVDLVQFPYPALRQEMSAGLLKPLWVNASQRLPQLPNVPTIAQLGHPELAAIARLAGVVGTTPGVPQENLTVLRSALKKAVHDPEFISKMKAANESTQYLDGQDTLKEVRTDIQLMKKYAPEIKAEINH